MIQYILSYHMISFCFIFQTCPFHMPTPIGHVKVTDHMTPDPIPYTIYGLSLDLSLSVYSHVSLLSLLIAMFSILS